MCIKKCFNCTCAYKFFKLRKQIKKFFIAHAHCAVRHFYIVFEQEEMFKLCMHRKKFSHCACTERNFWIKFKVWTMSLLRMNRRRSWNKRRWLSWWWAFSRSTRFSPPEHPPRQAGRPILPTSGWCPSSTGIPRVNCLVFVTYSIFLNISQNNWHFFVF